MKKQIYFVQINSVFGSAVKSIYLPYSVGTIAAYAWADAEIFDAYTLNPFIFMRDDIHVITNRLQEPFLVAFSCYVWNMEYNKALAKCIKEKYPHCKILMGGHNVTPDASELTNFPYVDYLIHGDGEEPFKALLLSLERGTPLDMIPNISFRTTAGQLVNTPKKLPTQDLSSYPSPYLEGYFDDILQDKSLNYSVIWETNRGCPNRCAYCDWGTLKSKVRLFPMERLHAEVEWMRIHQIEFIYCADANFGMFDRDENITDWMIASKRTSGYPKVFKTNFAKNRNAFVFKLSQKLYRDNLGKSPTLSFQTLNPAVLNNIGRNNISMEHFRKLMQLYTENGIMAYSELILGLPGETYDSFTQGIETLLECGQHQNLVVYPCELLPNSELSQKEIVKQYQIRLCQTEFRQHHSIIDTQSIKEYSNMIIATYSMQEEDWKQSFAFALYIQGFHSLCLTIFPAIFLHEENGVGYKEFYESFLQWCDTNPKSFCGQLYQECLQYIDDLLGGKASLKELFPGMGEITWGFDEYLFMQGALHTDIFFAEFRTYTQQYDVDADAFNALLTYQQQLIKKPRNRLFVFETPYDFESYFSAIFAGKYTPLQKRRCRITLTEQEPVDTTEEYAKKYIWYGRRNEAPIYSKQRGNLQIEYLGDAD